jgi:hypothetical protein
MIEVTYNISILGYQEFAEIPRDISFFLFFLELARVRLQVFE